MADPKEVQEVTHVFPTPANPLVHAGVPNQNQEVADVLPTPANPPVQDGVPAEPEQPLVDSTGEGNQVPCVTNVVKKENVTCTVNVHPESPSDTSVSGTVESKAVTTKHSLSAIETILKPFTDEETGEAFIYLMDKQSYAYLVDLESQLSSSTNVVKTQKKTSTFSDTSVSGTVCSSQAIASNPSPSSKGTVSSSQAIASNPAPSSKETTPQTDMEVGEVALPFHFCQCA